jgi:hypothetical protein
MKSNLAFTRILAASALCACLSGCLFKPATVTTRRFVLTPVGTEMHAGLGNQIAVGLGRVTMPDYLLRDSMVVRKSDNELEQLENALWAERLDHAFQRVLAANLSSHLGGGRVRVSSWQPGEVTLVARVSVERLDVDSQGRGTLTARWQIEPGESGKVLKHGESSLNKSGAAPYSDPATIAATLSDLTAQFSEVLANALRESAPTAATR